MKKELKFKLTNKSLPLLPCLKREMLQEIKMEGDNLIITFSLTSNADFAASLAGFEAKKVEIKTNLLDDADCNIEISKRFSKKMLKEKSKLGYGKKANIYAIREFIKIYKDYPLYFEHALVGKEKVHLILNGKAQVEVKVMMNCSEISYTFED
ncbi:MAG: hypothetical protein IJY90_03405 [Clostridia bacterium]|nr:hypothetical protein [Clostridia bacterium]